MPPIYYVFSAASLLFAVPGTLVAIKILMKKPEKREKGKGPAGTP